MAYTIAFFGSKPYDEASFNEKNKEYGFELRYYKGHLNKHNVILTQGVDAVCIFVNDTADTEVIRLMADNGVKLLALRCAGYRAGHPRYPAETRPRPEANFLVNSFWLSLTAFFAVAFSSSVASSAKPLGLPSSSA